MFVLQVICILEQLSDTSVFSVFWLYIMVKLNISDTLSFADHLMMTSIRAHNNYFSFEWTRCFLDPFFLFTVGDQDHKYDCVRGPIRRGWCSGLNLSVCLFAYMNNTENEHWRCHKLVVTSQNVLNWDLRTEHRETFTLLQMNMKTASAHTSILYSEAHTFKWSNIKQHISEWRWALVQFKMKYIVKTKQLYHTDAQKFFYSNIAFMYLLIDFPTLSTMA